MKRKYIWIIVGVVVIGGFVISLSMANLAMSNTWLDGEQEKAIKGDLVIPVTATGTVQANKLIQIKSKAGGQVSKIHVVEGQVVKERDTLIELDPVDEKRNVEARQAELDRTRSLYEKSKITLESQKRELPLQTERAKARLELAAFQWQKMKDYKGLEVAGEVEYVNVKTGFEQSDADFKSAQNNEEILLKAAEQDVTQAEAALRSAQKALDEAKQRFIETKVVARGPGMIYSILVREGEMIQSGTSTFTGGTLLLTMVDVSAVLVMAQVDEADIGAIRKIAPEYARPGTTKKLSDEEYMAKATELLQQAEGSIVDATVDAYRAETYKGVIDRILPEPQRVNNALVFNVLVRLTGEDLTKLIGLQADLTFTTEKITNVVLVKNEALVSEGRDCFVYVPFRKGGSRWDEKKVPVRIGTTDGTYTEILSGIKEGDAVWTKRPQRTEKEKRETRSAA